VRHCHRKEKAIKAKGASYRVVRERSWDQLAGRVPLSIPYLRELHIAKREISNNKALKEKEKKSCPYITVRVVKAANSVGTVPSRTPVSK